MAPLGTAPTGTANTHDLRQNAQMVQDLLPLGGPVTPPVYGVRRVRFSGRESSRVAVEQRQLFYFSTAVSTAPRRKNMVQGLGSRVCSRISGSV